MKKGKSEISLFAYDMIVSAEKTKNSTKKKTKKELIGDFSKVIGRIMHLPQFVFLYNSYDNSDTNEKHSISYNSQIMKYLGFSF